MRLITISLTLVALAAVSACQTNAGNDPDSLTYSRSNANRAKTDDPVKALQRY